MLAKFRVGDESDLFISVTCYDFLAVSMLTIDFFSTRVR